MLDSLEGISRAKSVGVLVEVITGRVTDVPGREAHPLLGAPSARRSHFWALPDQSIKFDQVGVHDDWIDA